MKYLMLFVTLMAVVGCDRPHWPNAGLPPMPSNDVRCVEFDRQTTRKGEKWTCRVLFCDHSLREEGGPTTLWCDKDAP